MPLKVMLSYSWENSAERAAIAAHLNSIPGLEVLYDKKDIRPGNPIHRRVSDLLGAADFVVAILTQEALKSKEVIDELTRANERGKEIVPIVSDGIDQLLIPAFLRDAAWLPYSPRDIDRALQSLSAHFIALLEEQSKNPILRAAGIQALPKIKQKGKTEIELKFESTTNLQFKFSALEPVEVVLMKFRALCDLLDIRVDEQHANQIEDEYFDDAIQSLGRNGCSFRRRDQDDLHLVTLKSHRGLSWLAALKRGEAEFQCSDDRLRQLLEDPREISREFRDRLGVEIVCGRLGRVLTVRTKRTRLDLQTLVSQYKFSHDRFYYIFRASNEEEYSEYNAEIELEAKGEAEQYDPQMEKLRSGISSLLLYAPNQKSKFQRGLEWLLRRREDVPRFFVLSFGIIGFSARPATVQKQQIQILNHHLKVSMKETLEGGSSSVVYLPTGDGMVLIFEESPKELIALVATVQESVRADVERKDVERFEFRVGIHLGPVFKYSDVNESLNYAGDGISIAHRLMILGDAGHILTSDAVYLKLREGGSASKFYDVGIFRGRSAGEMRVFSVYGNGFGNSERPAESKLTLDS